jgi:hypothetical protein
VVLEATRESEMKTTIGRTCLILGLLGFALSAALSVDLKARHDGVTVQAHMASTMLLQSSPDSDENACIRRGGRSPAAREQGVHRAR